MPKSKRDLESLAQAVSDDESVDWSEAAKHAEGDDQDLVDALETISEVTTNPFQAPKKTLFAPSSSSWREMSTIFTFLALFPTFAGERSPVQRSVPLKNVGKFG